MEHPAPVNFCQVCGTPMKQERAFGVQRPVCPSCGHIHFQDPKVAAAVLVERDGKVLLVRRVNVPEQGKWTLPAGFVEGDEDPRDTAVRECLEETGLRVKITDLLDVICGLEHPRGASIVLVYLGEVVGGDLIPSDDADAARFFGVDELPPIGFEATKSALKQWRSGY